MCVDRLAFFTCGLHRQKMVSMPFRPLRRTIIIIIIIIVIYAMLYIFGSLEKANDNFDIRNLNDFFASIRRIIR